MAAIWTELIATHILLLLFLFAPGLILKLYNLSSARAGLLYQTPHASKMLVHYLLPPPSKLILTTLLGENVTKVSRSISSRSQFRKAITAIISLNSSLSPDAQIRS